jgi:hypothetical protein
MYANASNGRGDRDELPVLPSGEEVPQAESTEVTKSTTETLMAGERILEALEVAELDRALLAEYHNAGGAASGAPYPTRNPIFSMYNNCSADEYVLKIVRGVPPAQQQDALLVLPFGRVMQLIEHIDVWANRVRPHSFLHLFETKLTFSTPFRRTGLATRPHFPCSLLPPPHSPLANRRDSCVATDDGRSSRSPS